MLIKPSSHLFIYTITRDFGFAPNPFHGRCTLATCKPRIRKAAEIDDWIMGVGGNDLGDVKGKCIFLMKVSEKITFQDYWYDQRFSLKKALRNGSKVRAVGDNIYHKDECDEWIQEDSHHSNSDGTAYIDNLKKDTGGSYILISDYFLYFGNQAKSIDLNAIEYERGLGHKKTNLSDSEEARNLITAILKKNSSNINLIIADPCDFMDARKRVDQGTGKSL